MGLRVIIEKEFFARGGMVYFTSPLLYWPVGLLLIFLGFYSFFSIVKNWKKKYIQYSKCPKCKETYTYKTLKKGMCPKCNIKTVDLEKYYSKNNNDKIEIWEELD
ncbi:hypothetical protein [Arcobacter sp.]|uniref:hypothetical protein n=1 Tax=unclassified Arcobacter TaxID=2593671 RepID=UPI003B00B3A5